MSATVEVRNADGTWVQVPYEGDLVELEERVEERALARFTTVMDGVDAASLLVQGARVRIFDAAVTGSGVGSATMDDVTITMDDSSASMDAEEGGGGALVPVFYGEIDTPDAERIRYSSRERVDVECVDAQAIADSRVARESYEDTEVGDIVRDLVDTYLATEGVTYTAESVEDGPVVPEVVLNYVPVSRALKRLAEATGFTYRIDPDLVLTFAPRDKVKAATTLTREHIIGDRARIRRANSKYRNRQYVKGGKGVTDPLTETFSGDGERVSFTVGFPIARAPSIEVNGQPQDVGIKGLETGKDWYWNKGDATIAQDHEDPPLTSSDSLAVEYRGQFDMVARAEDVDEAARLALLTGGSGIVEAVADIEPLANRAGVLGYASNLLARWASRGRHVTVSLREPLYHAGELAEVYLPDHGLVDGSGAPLQMLVTSVVARPDPRAMTYEVTFAEGYSEGSWAEVFRQIADEGREVLDAIVAGEDGTLSLLESFPADWEWGEDDTVDVYACPVPSSDLYPSATLYPC